MDPRQEFKANLVGAKIIFNDKSEKPKCPHGPTVLFEKVTKGVAKQFYSCSAYRDRKFCDFYHVKNEKVTNGKTVKWAVQRKDLIRNKEHGKLYCDYLTLTGDDDISLIFCQDCGVLGEKGKTFEKDHESHKMKSIEREDLSRPSQILEAEGRTRKEAQYFFNKQTCDFITNSLSSQNISHVLCIGSPTIFESLNAQNSSIKTLFLDIDSRYLALYSPLQFCWYNFTNGYFFLGEASQSVYEDFVREGGENLAIVLDPPFGVKSELIGEGFKRISSDVVEMAETKNVPAIFWVFPYFMESKVKETGLNMAMSDYKVDYDNHKQFSGGEGQGGRKQGSPVRIFTNVDLRKLALPKEEGYKLCSKCEFWVSEENEHCDKCKACTSKDGRTYVHCDPCGRCVKPTWSHCLECDRCLLPTHDCKTVQGRIQIKAGDKYNQNDKNVLVNKKPEKQGGNMKRKHEQSSKPGNAKKKKKTFIGKNGVKIRNFNPEVAKKKKKKKNKGPPTIIPR